MLDGGCYSYHSVDPELTTSSRPCGPSYVGHDGLFAQCFAMPLGDAISTGESGIVVAIAAGKTSIYPIYVWLGVVHKIDVICSFPW